MSEEENIRRITTSSALLLQLHDIDTKDIQNFLEDMKVKTGGSYGFNVKKPNAREFIEHRGPQVQGKNAFTLANHIMEKNGDPSYNDLQELARKFNNDWNSNTCYLCGQKIIKGQNEELEHIVPVAEAFAVLDIIQDNQTEFKRKLDDTMKDEKKNTYTKYLLEYRRSHACCNQLKSNTSFLHWDKGNYVVNESVLRNFFARLHSVIGERKFRGEREVCGNQQLKNQKEKNKKRFIDLRTTDVTNNYLNPIATFVTKQRSKLGGNMMELSYLANQALSVHPVIWLMKKGDASLTTNKSDIEIFKKKVIDGLENVYKNGRAKILLKIQDSVLIDKVKLYCNARIVNDMIAQPRRSERKVDSTVFMRLLNVDYAHFKDKHKVFCEKKYKEKYKEKFAEWEDYFKHECWFGIYFFNLLLESQQLAEADIMKLPNNLRDLAKIFPSMKYLEKDVPRMVELINQINDYVIFYIYMHIIFTVNSDAARKFDLILYGRYPLEITSNVDNFLNVEQYALSSNYVNYHLVSEDIITTLMSKALPHYNFILKKNNELFIDGRSPLNFTKEIINEIRLFEREEIVAEYMIKRKRESDLANKFATIWKESVANSKQVNEAAVTLMTMSAAQADDEYEYVKKELERDVGMKVVVSEDPWEAVKGLVELKQVNVLGKRERGIYETVESDETGEMDTDKEPDVIFMDAVKELHKYPITGEEYLIKNDMDTTAGAKYKYVPNVITYVYGKYITDPIKKQKNSVKKREAKKKDGKKRAQTKRDKKDQKPTPKYPNKRKTKKN